MLCRVSKYDWKKIPGSMMKYLQERNDGSESKAESVSISEIFWSEVLFKEEMKSNEYPTSM